jgi:ring-1,2-phenylacetyl-CoA epoxidase subunit PaaD
VVGSAAAWTAAESTAWAALQAVTDPEIPVLSVVDLGLVRHIKCDANGQIEVGLSPTYSGCPALVVIRGAVIAALRAAGFEHPCVIEVLSPPWTSDWLSAEGKNKLRRYGIAPPVQAVKSPKALWLQAPTVHCPRCGSGVTEELSHFGSTPCKALYRCKNCLEPFEYFKCI